jgi:two-component system, cell cycle sensor histidine kinase and response regulator CckA
MAPQKPSSRNRAVPSASRRTLRTSPEALTEHGELRALYDVTAIVARGGALADAADRIAAAVRQHSGCRVTAIELFDRAAGTAGIIGWAGPAMPRRIRTAGVPLEGGLSGRLLRKHTPLVTRVQGERPSGLHPAMQRAGINLLVSVSIRVDGKVRGALHAGLSGVRSATPDFLTFLSTLAAEVSWLIARQDADALLRASTDQYHHLFENALDAIFIIDPATGLIVDANVSARTLAGRRRKELVGASILLLAPEEEKGAHARAFSRLRVEGEIRTLRSLHFRHRKGHLVAVEINARVVSIGDRTLAVAILRNITEQKRAEVQLTASEELLRIIVEGTLDMFFYVHNTKGVFTYVSPSVVRITGHSSEDWIAHYEKFATDSPVNVKMRENTEDAMRSGAIAEPYPCEIWHADGRRILLEINERPIFRDGIVIGVQGVARDITERRRLEEQLIQSQKMESIGLLAGGIAHDFNNILGGILGYASYLKSVVPVNDRIYQHLDTIERSALRAADLTAKLLAFARGGKYVVKPININAVIEETLRLLRGSFDKNIVIEERLARDVPAIEADAGQMQQVIMNLCVNARDAMPGGGRLTLTTSVVPWPTAVLVSQPDVRHTPHVCVTVRDTGSGIDPAILGKIFDPFFTTKEKGKGTGLGLATVYGIVKNHNGNIDVKSEIGRGTTFDVLFPAVEMKAVSQEERLEVVSGGNETILVVDDEETIRRLLRDLLAAKGYHVLEAADGRQALSVYMEHDKEIDLVILDMVMPEMGGREAYVRLRELNPRIRTILSTGYAEDDRARELMSMGVMAFVQKPYRVEELAAVVRSVLDHPREGR